MSCALREGSFGVLHQIAQWRCKKAEHQQALGAPTHPRVRQVANNNGQCSTALSQSSEALSPSPYTTSFQL